LRIDDLDRDRSIPGVAGEIIATLARFGFEWDGTICFQSLRNDLYRAALSDIVKRGLTYPCRCSRSVLSALQAAEPRAEPVYPGTCRNDPSAASAAHALRFRILESEPPVEFEDAFQGPVRQDCVAEAGDFIVRRRDGPIAYHLATVVDDADQGVTEVVRGADLLSSTPRQILVQRALGLPEPRYAHLPLLMEPDGRKLSKSRRAVPLASAAAHELWRVLTWLGQAPPPELAAVPVRAIWDWAIPAWRPEAVAGIRELRLDAARDP
jgi:glutamyl-Q tRNA(Asp) synthetase